MMKKHALEMILIAGAILAPSLAFAQATSTSFVLIDQGYVDSATSTPNAGAIHGSIYEFYLGTGFSGSTTGGFVSVNTNGFGLIHSGDSRTIQVSISQYSDPDYSDAIGGCTLVNHDANAYDGFVPLDVYSTSGAGCIFSPSDYVQVNLAYYGFEPPAQADYPIDSIIGTYTNYKNFIVCQYGQDPNPPSFTQCSDTFYPNFSIVSNNFTIPSPNYNSLATSTCSITNITGCFQNALVWAFFPPAGSLNPIYSLQGQLNTKPPFGYFTQAQNDISNLGAATSSMYTLPAVAGITEYIFNPLDLGLTAIWWALVGIWFFFHRVRHIEI